MMTRRSSRLARFLIPVAVLLLVLIGGLAQQAQANLIVNGSFEIGPDPGQFGLNLPAGSTAITGWTVGGFDIDYVAPGTWNASDGLRTIDLDGSVLTLPRSGVISQQFSTQPGQKYVVTFDLSGNVAGLPLIKQLRVTAASDSELFSYDIGSVRPLIRPFTIAYDHEIFLFTATSTLTTLAFQSLTPPDISGFGAVIDNVVVLQAQTVPTPSTLFLLGISAIGLAWGVRREARKKRLVVPLMS
jgi:choice-of-anchor C domain-containing protein